jgi:dihydroflavonol-4-reductase
MNKTLVTGAAGFIGSHVVRELLAKNREVKAVILPGENTKNLDGLQVERVEADLCDPDAIEKAMQGVDRVFHLAAIYATWLPRREKMYEVNCVGSLNLLWAALKAGVRRVVYTSSIAAVGVKGNGQPSAENDTFNKMGQANDYVVFCNPAFPFGARDIAPTPTGQILLDIVNGKNIFYFDSGFNVVDVEDVAQGHLLADEKGRTGERYILGNQNIPMKEFFYLIARATGAKFTPIKLPVAMVILVADWMEHRADTVTRKPPLFAGSAVRYARSYLYVDSSKARQELGYTTRPVEESIRRAVDWYAANGYITNRKFLQQYKR